MTFEVLLFASALAAAAIPAVRGRWAQSAARIPLACRTQVARADRPGR